MPANSAIYCYGYLGGKTSLTFHTCMRQKGLTIKPFSNFKPDTVKNHLEEALVDISNIIHLPHFKTKVGKKFKLKEINEALRYTSEKGGKEVLWMAE